MAVDRTGWILHQHRKAPKFEIVPLATPKGTYEFDNRSVALFPHREAQLSYVPFDRVPPKFLDRLNNGSRAAGGDGRSRAVVYFMDGKGWAWGKIAAGGTMVMLPVLIFSFIVRKFLIQGMAAGVVKG